MTKSDALPSNLLSTLATYPYFVDGVNITAMAGKEIERLTRERDALQAQRDKYHVTLQHIAEADVKGRFPIIPQGWLGELAGNSLVPADNATPVKVEP